jgi:uncharacterized protein involved in copper resistance
MKRTLIATAALAFLPALAAAHAPQGTQQGQATTTMQQDSSRMRQDSTGMRRSMGSDSATHRRHAKRTKHRTMRHRARTDSSMSPGKAPNQTETGVVDTKTGASTLGTGVKKTRPDQGQPTTSKGDTLKRGGDSVGRPTPKPPR